MIHYSFPHILQVLGHVTKSEVSRPRALLSIDTLHAAMLEGEDECKFQGRVGQSRRRSAMVFSDRYFPGDLHTSNDRSIISRK